MLKEIVLAAAFMAAVPVATMATERDGRGLKVKVTAGDQVLTATFLDNATTRALVERFPLTVPMANLYSREMVHRFPEPLPSEEARTSGYDVGEIVYWTPRHSLVIMYAQNGERISNLQQIGRINVGVEIFKDMRDVDVTFELLKE